MDSYIIGIDLLQFWINFVYLFCREDDVGDDDIIFEDFARLRLKGETDAWPFNRKIVNWIKNIKNVHNFSKCCYLIDWNVCFLLDTVATNYALKNSPETEGKLIHSFFSFISSILDDASPIIILVSLFRRCRRFFNVSFFSFGISKEPEVFVPSGGLKIDGNNSISSHSLILLSKVIIVNNCTRIIIGKLSSHRSSKFDDCFACSNSK